MNDISSLYIITFLFRVLDNLKDYTVKALVNAVDHLGTVASKLTDLFDQQNSDISTMELRASCVSQVTKLSHTSLFIGLTFSRQPPLDLCMFFSSATAYMPDLYRQRRS